MFSRFLLFEKLSGVRTLTTFYLAKNDHRWGWVTFISLKTINRELPLQLTVWPASRRALTYKDQEEVCIRSTNC